MVIEAVLRLKYVLSAGRGGVCNLRGHKCNFLEPVVLNLEKTSEYEGNALLHYIFNSEDRG